MSEVTVWAEHYRPKTIDECILPDAIKKMVKDSIASGNIPSFIFAGSAGCGKTSLAKAIAHDVGADLLYINASLDTSIDNIRDKVVSYSSSVSFDGNLKMILLDEGEGLSQQAMNSLKGIYEQFPNVRFIVTTNALAKVIEPLKSRSVVIEFKVDPKDRPKLSAQMMKRIVSILTERGIKYDAKVVVELVNKFFPDFRRTLNELQRYAASGTIDSGVLVGAAKGSFRDITNILRDKNFKAMCLWVGENASDDVQLYTDFYDNAFEYFVPESVPQMILFLHKYSTEGRDAADPRITLASFFTELMQHCSFRE